MSTCGMTLIVLPAISTLVRKVIETVSESFCSLKDRTHIQIHKYTSIFWTETRNPEEVEITVEIAVAWPTRLPSLNWQ